MTFKDLWFYPAMNRSIGGSDFGELRKAALAQASGRILEIGFGSGLNLPWYPSNVHSIVAVDVSSTPIVDCPAGFHVDFMKMSADNLCLADNSFDTVVSTFTLCSVPCVQDVLSEVFRVLVPGGRFLFLEHGRAWNRPTVILQNLVNPFFRIFAFGCNVNRNILEELNKSRLQVTSLERRKFKSQPVSGFHYLGAAMKPANGDDHR